MSKNLRVNLSNYKVLEKFMGDSEKILDINLIVIFHLLKSSTPFLVELSKAFNIITIIGIPYSVDMECVKKLRLSSINVIIPDTIDDIENIVLDQIQPYSKEKFIILEVGGYCANIVNEIKQRNSNFIGVVEDTNQGHWQYEKLPYINIPIFSIARSPIKNLENRLIGKAVVYSLENFIRKQFMLTLCGKKVGLLGYGNIGNSAAKALKARDSIVYIWDTNPIKRIEARLDGYLPESKKSLLSKCDIILGVTGNQSISRDDFSNIKNGAILASGSSKKIEFDIDYIENNYQKEKTDSKKLSKYIHNSKLFFLMNDGMPINFDDGSVLDSILDIIFTELFMCLKAMLNKPYDAGIHMLDHKSHSLICRVWEENYL